jgi:hypothetical protein
MEIAEVADQHIIAEAAETGWCESDPPGCCEAAAGDQFLNEVAVFIENRHGPRPPRAPVSCFEVRRAHRSRKHRRQCPGRMPDLTPPRHIPTLPTAADFRTIKDGPPSTQAVRKFARSIRS